MTPPAARRSPVALGYAALGGAGLLAAVATGSPAFAALAAPFVVAALVGAVLPGPATVDVGLRVAPERVLEGDHATVVVSLRPDRATVVELLWVATPGLTALPQGPARRLVVGAAGRDVEIEVEATRWGAPRPADVVVRTRDLLGLAAAERRVRSDAVLRVHPSTTALRRTVRPADTQVLAGNQTARRVGEGTELADLRPHAPGDRLRDVNWRVTARRGEMWVNQRHPDRNADVVLFLDVFTDDHLDDAVRAAAAVAARLLRHRDRVGLVSYGGAVGWLLPRGGERELHRIVDALITSHAVESSADKPLEVIPRRALPPEALVLALTPLDDPRTIGALEQLRARRRDVAVIELAGAIEPPAPGDAAGELAQRLWRCQRSATRARLRGIGIAVAEWQPTDDAAAPLAQITEELQAWRARARRAG